MRFGFALPAPRFSLLVLASISLVHWLPPADAAAQAPSKPRPSATSPAQAAAPAQSSSALPSPVGDMRDAIMAAVASGDIEEMRTALDWNELKPELADGPVADAIAYWRSISADGQGRDILAVLGEILNQPFAVLPVGRDVENNRLYVWPRFAEAGTVSLTQAEREAMQRLIPADVRGEMAKSGRYLWWRLVIGADGTWHAFVKAR